MIFKAKCFSSALLAVALLTTAGVTQAQDEERFLQNSLGEAVRNSLGECVLTAGGSVLPECLPAVVEVAPAPIPTVSSMSMGADAFFDFDKSNLKPEGEAKLAALASDMSTVDVQSVDIVGHTDAIGTEQYNQALSERRARSAADFLVGQGVNPGLISTRGMGETQPVATNQTPEGRAQNRRVDITVVAEGAQ